MKPEHELRNELYAIGYFDIDIEPAKTSKSVYVRADHILLGKIKVRISNHPPSARFTRDKSCHLYTIKPTGIRKLIKQLRYLIRARSIQQCQEFGVPIPEQFNIGPHY